MVKLSKNNVDKSGIITYNKDTLKNGHQTDATRINRSRSGTRKLVKSKRCFPEVQGRRRFRWIQLKNSFIVAAYMIGKLFPHGMPYRYNLKQVPTRMPVRHRLKYRDVGIRLPVMFCQDCSKTQDIGSVSRALGYITQTLRNCWKDWYNIVSVQAVTVTDATCLDSL